MLLFNRRLLPVANKIYPSLYKNIYNIQKRGLKVIVNKEPNGASQVIVDDGDDCNISKSDFTSKSIPKPIAKKVEEIDNIKDETVNQFINKWKKFENTKKYKSKFNDKIYNKKVNYEYSSSFTYKLRYMVIGMISGCLILYFEYPTYSKLDWVDFAAVSLFGVLFYPITITYATLYFGFGAYLYLKNQLPDYSKDKLQNLYETVDKYYKDGKEKVKSFIDKFDK